MGFWAKLQWFLGFGRGRGREAGSKNGFSWNSDPSVLQGRCSAASDSIGRCELQKMEHSNLGLRRDGASINEGKDPERVGHLDNPPTKDWDELVAMLSPAYMVGQLERGRQGRSIGSSLSSGRTQVLCRNQEGLALAHFEEARAGTAAVTYARRPTPGTQDLGSLAQGLRAAQARHRPRTGRLGTSSPPRASSRKFPPKFKSSTWAIWSAFTARISNSSTKQMCAESDLGRSRSRQEPLCPPSAGSRGLLP